MKLPSDEDIKKTPNEFKVDNLNSRLINKKYDSFLLKSRVEFIDALKIMFQSSDCFIDSIEHIIKNWSKDSYVLISKIITQLHITNFSREALSSLILYYLNDMDDAQIQTIDLSRIPIKILRLFKKLNKKKFN